MIVWKDFVLDDVCGPLLHEGLVKNTDIKVCRGKRIAVSNVASKVVPDVMEDSMSVQAVQIQETGQEQRPARMVGHSGLDSKSSAGREARWHERDSHSRQKEEA